jgi:phenylalanyl-tRNA synthetase beta chain
MKISLNWLKDYIDVNIDAKELADILTGIGLEVEGIEICTRRPQWVYHR